MPLIVADSALCFSSVLMLNVHNESRLSQSIREIRFLTRVACDDSGLSSSERKLIMCETNCN